jgi:hypothetical protein
MADLRDFTGKNRKFTGTIGERISTGTTAERDTATFGGGTIRFNTTTNLMEYYTGNEWKSIDAPPTITNFNIDGAGTTTSTFIDRTLSGNTSIVITGSLYSAGAVVSFRGNSGANFDATTTTFNSASQLTAVVPYSSFLAAQEPYSIRVTNLSGLFAQLDGCLAVDAAPVFTTASGTLGTIFDSNRSSYSLSSAAATDPDGDTITYSITSGALPAGLSISSSTGAITGTASAVESNTTSTFTVSAATTNQTATRQFSITVNAPSITSYTSTGSFTYSVPTGVTSVNVLLVAGGAYGGGGTGGGGGAGGMVEVASFPVTPGGSVPGSVGAGAPSGMEVQPGNGGDSTFGSLTAVGGGSGGWDNGPSGRGGQPGGSGGGANGHNPRANSAGSGIQPSQPGTSGSSGHGSNGGASPGPDGGGGGGGAGAAGSNANGGAGRSSSISGSPVTYAGGGAAGHSSSTPGSAGPGGGGAGNTFAASGGSPGSTNRGGGGGGAWNHNTPGGGGGPGIVIVRV